MIFSAIERKIAIRYLRARRKDGFISVISGFSIAGIALGVATLIVVTSVMNGVRDEMLSHMIGWNGHVMVYSTGRGIADYDQMADELRATPGIKRIVPMVEGQAMVTAGARSQGVAVSGITLDDLKAKAHITERIVEGNLDEFTKGEGIIIGQRMADNLGVKVGDALTLISPQGRATIAGMVPRIKAYPISAIFKFGMVAFDSGYILMPREAAQIYFGMTMNARMGADGKPYYFREPVKTVTALEIETNNIDQAVTIANNLRAKLGPGYRVYDWMMSNKQIFDALEIQRNVMFLILTLIVIVAAFNIISSLIMLVKDKGQDIAILRTMGASQGTVMRIFFACGTSIGTIGTFIGLALGLLLALNVERIRLWIESVTGRELLGEQLYFLQTLPSKVNGMEVIAVVAMALGLSFLATLYPARRAARIDPAEGLRYE